MIKKYFFLKNFFFFLMFGINHYKSVAKDEFLPMKFYNFKLDAKLEKGEVFRVSAKDFYLNLRNSYTNFPKTTNRFIPSPRKYNRSINPEEKCFNENYVWPVMKPFSTNRLRTVKNLNSNQKLKRKLINQNEQLCVLGSNNPHTNLAYIENESLEGPMILKNTKIQSLLKNRPLTATIQNRSVDSKFDLISFKSKKRKQLPLEMKRIIKVPEVHNLIRLASYEKQKRKEEIEGMLDVPEKEIFVQRPLSSDVLMRFSQENSIKRKFQAFIEKRNNF